MLRTLFAFLLALALLNIVPVSGSAQTQDVIVHLGGSPLGGSISGAPGSTVSVPALIIGSTGMAPSVRPEITVPAPLKTLATSTCTAETIQATAGAATVFRACEIVGWDGPNGSQIISTEVEKLSSMVGFRINAWLQIEIPNSTPVGSSYKLTAPSVEANGFPTLSEFTINVVGPNPTAPAEHVEDNRIVYLETSPQFLRIAPGGEFLYVVQPVRWGMWNGQHPRITLQVTVPKGISAIADPKCGRGDMIPSTRCEMTTIDMADGRKTYLIEPGHSSNDDALNGVYLQLQADSAVAEEQVLHIEVDAEVADESLPSQPNGVLSTIQIISEEMIMATRSSHGTQTVVLEASQAYSASGSTCELSSDPWTLGLYEVQLQSRFSSATAGSGTLSLATDGTGTEVCLVPVVFENVPERDLYVIATYQGDDPPCRACVLGTIPRASSADVVFRID